MTPSAEVIEACAYRDLRKAISKLHRVWFTGADLDKDKISQACLTLFKDDHDIAVAYERMTGAAPDRRAKARCCSAASPCNHQKKSPHTVCAACEAAAANG